MSSGRVPDIRRARRAAGTYALLAGLLSVVLVVAVNVTSYRLHSRPSLRVVGSSLLDESQNTLGQLSRGDEYRLVSFAPRGDVRGDRLDALLERYSMVSDEVGGPRVLRRRVDLNRDVKDTTVDALGLRDNTNLVDNALVVARRTGESFTCRILHDASAHFGPESAHTNGVEALERRINAAMLGLAHGGRTPNVCFLAGHGELGFGEFAPTGGESLELFARNLRDHGFRPRTTVLAGGDSPEASDALLDCDLLVIAGARTALTVPTEMQLARYAARNGKFLVLLNGAPSAGLADLLERWDIHVETSGAGLGDAASLSQITLPLARADHPILNGLGLRRLTLLRPLPLRTAGNSSVAVSETLPQRGGEGTEPERRRPAAVALVEAPQRIAATNRLAYAVAAERGDSKSGECSRIVVVGDVRFLENRMLAEGYAANIDFAMSCVNWLLEADSQPGAEAEPAAPPDRNAASDAGSGPLKEGWLGRTLAGVVPARALMHVRIVLPFAAPPLAFLLLGLLYVRATRKHI